ncbi:arylamine N-acetyltransferase family protein [Chryseobacterium jejuense]|uniref:Arylamine N-acetyltransferase n=1 Tax=Chryseobacterium jejuense TaxID=445960 RepID=A0A2X2VDT8_CHRJE|nr:arylamine N-acetyltransferase [Chryseobacterium jejuense]SDI25606.1 N-hydroxyarylamine O-acetyltransferase [Chryseobacterium jejuense]SQB26708.1 Arylamine N-acetyltransferase [Chryseobacterium jejuense]
MNDLKLEKYLKRIHYSGDLGANMEVLKKIHQLHPQYIPFENIDSYTGKVPSLDLENVFQKLVVESRGGYCYEQNLLLSEILTYLGFKVELQLGRVLWRKDENSTAAKTHLLLIVELNNQKYLVDCGFGTATLTGPLLLNEEAAQDTPNEQFKISQKNGAYTLWTWREKWLPVYRFDLEYVEPLDLEICNWYLTTYPESNFRKNLVFSKVDENTRYTFSNHTLNVRKTTGGKESVAIENDVQLFQMLKDVFGLNENAIELLKQKA